MIIRIFFTLTVVFMFSSCEKNSDEILGSEEWTNSFKKDLDSVVCYRVSTNTIWVKNYFNGSGLQVYAEHYDYDIEGKLLYSLSYEYEKDNILKSKTFRDSSGAIMKKITYTLSFNNDKITEAWSPVNNPFRKAVYEYNNDNLPTVRTDYFPGGGQTLNTINYSADKKPLSILSERKNSTSDYSLEMKYDYNAQGNLSSIVMDVRGNLWRIINFQYDENGFLKSHDDTYGEDVWTTQYVNDDLGRVQDILQDGEPVYRYEYSGDFSINYSLEPGDFIHDYHGNTMFYKFWTTNGGSPGMEVNSYYQY